MVAEVAEREGDALITWYCWALWPKLTIRGTWPPSRLPEIVSWDMRNRFSFELVDGQVVLESRVKQGRFENLHVDAGELGAAIEELRDRDVQRTPYGDENHAHARCEKSN